MFLNRRPVKIFGNSPKNQNCLHKEIKSQQNWENASYHSVQNLLFPYLSSKHVKIKIHRNMSLYVVCGRETRSLTLKVKHTLRMSENRVLKRIYGHKRGKVTWDWRRQHTEEINVLHSSPNIVLSNQE